MTPPAGSRWWEDGERTFGTATGRLVEEDFTRPSLLPGWTRAHVLAHVAGNADALVNLLTWARTGIETPMYASAQERDAEIARRAGLSPPSQRQEVAASTERLAAAVRALPADAWSAEVCTAQGRTVPADEVLWIRAREVWVHAIDLDAGVGFNELPDDALVALTDEVFRTWQRRGVVPDITVSAGGRQWGSGAVLIDGATLAATVGWLTGRGAATQLSRAQDLPELPPWL